MVGFDHRTHGHFFMHVSEILIIYNDIKQLLQLFLYHGKIAIAKVLSYKSMNVCVFSITTEMYRGGYQPTGNHLHFYLHETAYISTLIMYSIVSLSSRGALFLQLFSSLSKLWAEITARFTDTIIAHSVVLRLRK